MPAVIAVSIMSIAANRGRLAKSQQASRRRPTTKRRRGRWRLLAVVVVLLAVLWWLPAIVAHTRLLQWVLGTVAKDLDGTVQVQSASLGWFSPIVAQGIEVRDRQDKPVLQAATLTGNKPLAAILLNTSLLGRFRLEGPKLDVVLRDGGSNLEDLLAEYLKPREEPSKVSLVLEVVDASVSLTDQDSRRAWQVENLNLTLTTTPGAAQPLELRASGAIADAAHPGRFDVELCTRQADANGSSAPAAGGLSVDATAVPLAMFDSVLGRFLPQTHLDGRLAGKINLQWAGGQPAANTAIQADVTAEDLALATPQLGTDRLRLERLHANCQLAQQGSQVEIKPSSLDCDLGNVQVDGQIDLAQQQSQSLLTWLLQQSYQVEAQLELARLASMLPQTLRIREDTQVTSGQVHLVLVSRRGPQGMTWQGQVQTSDLTAVHQGRQLAWEKPILVVLAAQESPQGPVVENLKWESSFLRLHAAGSLQQMTASASFDLRQLAEQLGQFVDLGGLGLAGEGWAQLNCTGSLDRRFQAHAELQLRNFQLAMPERIPWTENNLTLLCSASGRADPATDIQLQDASLQLRTPTDQIDARVTQPVVDFRGGGSWPVELTMKGQLQAWPARMRTWIALGDCTLAGDYELSAQVAGSRDGLAIHQARLILNQLQLVTRQLNVNEPRVELVARGSYQRQAGIVELDQLVLRSAALGADLKGQVVRADGQTDLELAGEVKYDMQRLVALARPYVGPGVQVAGGGVSPVSYRGPPSLVKARATAGADWQWANVYGFQVGPGQLKADLAGGLLSVQPMDLAVSQGRVLLAPQVRLTPEPVELTLPPGPLARQVQITPAMCDQALKYIAPVLAGVTAAQGAFSIELDACRIPLNEPAEGQLAGRFIIHSVEVGPGPLVQELAVLLGRASPATLRRESVVSFRMADRRIYHEGLELQFPDLTIRTQGSVGMDQTLALMAEMPVPPKWIGTNVLGSALRGQTIRLPIGGTLKQPRIDRNVLDQLSRQFIGNAARNLIEDQLAPQLNRLLGPPR